MLGLTVSPLEFGSPRRYNPPSMNPTHERGFFTELSRLASSEENQLSRTFTVCFRESQDFRRRVVGLLWETCRIVGKPPDPDVWKCDAEVATPSSRKGRLDVRIRAYSHPGGRQRSQPEFCLENKLGALLTEKQIKKYVHDGVKHLVVVTKYYPDVPPNRIQELGADALRWQDFHRVMSEGGHRTSVERRVAEWFVDYLEQMGMAYQDSPTLAEVASCRRVLRVAAADRYKNMVPRRAFRSFDSLLVVLEDAYIGFVTQNPRFGKWKHRWGPGFWRWFEEPGKAYHAIGWLLYKTTRNGERLECAIAFPDNPNEPAEVWIQTYTSPNEIDNPFAPYSLRDVSVKGRLDVHKLVGELTACANEWKL